MLEESLLVVSDYSREAWAAPCTLPSTLTHVSGLRFPMLLPSFLAAICCHQLFNKAQHGLCSSRSCRSLQATGKVSLHVRWAPRLPQSLQLAKVLFPGQAARCGPCHIHHCALVLAASTFPSWKGAESPRCSEHLLGEWAMALTAQLRTLIMYFIIIKDTY